jgi:anhydro-N-acetylmuramic acid kinase
MLSDPFFSLAPPKSTGRDLFNHTWLSKHLLTYRQLAAADVAHTLVMLSAQTIYQSIQQHCTGTEEVFLCGGGARNQLLVDHLQCLFKSIPVTSTDALNVGVDWVEAAAFAWLAEQTIARRPSNLPSVTGASGFRILGAIYPA